MNDDYNRDLYCICGLPFDAITSIEAASKVIESVENRNQCFLSTPNLNFLIACEKDVDFRDSVINSELSIADGMPIIWIARLLGLPFQDRIAGSSLFEQLGKATDAKKILKVFFFGGEEGIAKRACEKIAQLYPAMRCGGYINPGFYSAYEMSKTEYIQIINASQSDFLVVSLGARKGQAWIENNRNFLSVPVISHLGAVINFVAGSVKRSPIIMQKMGLEWLWRIKEEPNLWRRYLHDGFALIRLLVNKVFPYALWMKMNRRHISYEKPVIEKVANSQSNEVHLRLLGSFHQEALEEFRSILRDLAKNQQNLILDLSGVSYIDSAFLGLILIHRKHCVSLGKTIEFKHIPTDVRKIFNWCGANFLLEA